MRAESGARGVDRKWLEKHSFDRTHDWERRGPEIMGRIASHEVKQVIAPLVSSGWYFATVESVTDAGVQPVYSIRVDSDDHAFLAAGFVNHNTESRLAPLAMQLLGEIDEDTVDFVPTYDGNTVEPVVLPARFPNLLVNGGGGIAVGMATNIPPHNLGEVIDAVQHLLEHPDATNQDLMQFVRGPDFPSGALILGRSGIHDAYTTGRGSIKMRAVAEIEETRKGDLRIAVTQVPYQTSVEVIGQKIAELVNDRKIEGIRDVRNESSGDTVRLVVELKRDANAQVVLNLLYKHTPMQTNFPVHMLALVDNVPRLLDLKTALAVYIEHQKEIIQRRTEFRLRKAKEREHIVEGLVKALDMIDAIIALIRGRGRRRRRAHRAHGGAVRVHRDPGQLHPRHAAAPAHAARGPEAARGARGAAGDHRRAAVDPRQPGQARRGDQGPSSPRCATSTPTSGAPSSPSTSATSTCSTSSTTKRSSSCCRARAT